MKLLVKDNSALSNMTFLCKYQENCKYLNLTWMYCNALGTLRSTLLPPKPFFIFSNIKFYGRVEGVCFVEIVRDTTSSFSNLNKCSCVECYGKSSVVYTDTSVCPFNYVDTVALDPSEIEESESAIEWGRHYGFELCDLPV